MDRIRKGKVRRREGMICQWIKEEREGVQKKRREQAREERKEEGNERRKEKRREE